METRRGRQKVERGPVSDYVAANVARLRKRRGVSQQGMSQHLAELGRPMLPSAISKIEGRERSVDVDDIMALAVALGVNPSALLLPPDACDSEVRITTAVSVPGWAAWQWVDAVAPLPTTSAENGYNSVHDHEAFLAARPDELRRTAQHPVMRAATAASVGAAGVVRHLVKLHGDPMSHKPLPTLLKRALRSVERLQSELELVEEQGADDRG